MHLFGSIVPATRALLTLFLLPTALMLIVEDAAGRTPVPPGEPKQPIVTSLSPPLGTMATTHRIGKLGMSVTNYGTLGSGYRSRGRRTMDAFTGDVALSCEYPRNSKGQYLFGAAFWIGGIVDRDTLVSTGADGWGYGVKHSLDNNGWRHRGMELSPDPHPFSVLERRSIMDPNSPLYEGALSEEDVIAVYTDTFPNGHRGLTFDSFHGRMHKPLNIRVTQTSYAWSYPYSEDFILIKLDVENMGDETIKDAYIGVHVDADVWGEGYLSKGNGDDLTGLFETVETSYGGCQFRDTVNLAWSADNDGDFQRNVPVPGVVGMRFLSAPYDLHLAPSYNWWVSNSKAILDFGPRKKGTTKEPYRDFQTGAMGTPEGDANKYSVLSNGDVDYDQAYTFDLDPDDPVWQYPNRVVSKYYSRGRDSKFLLSVGPFDIAPGRLSTVNMAFVASEKFHTDHMNFRNYLQVRSYYPDQFYQHLGIEDFGKNAMWAQWVYDNPGVDTDGDGYFGKYRMCCADSTIFSIDTFGTAIDTTWVDICDTVWYAGDGASDFRGATAPPSPELWVRGEVGKINVRWNGHSSENTPDLFSRKVDFDGYRVYIGRDNRHASFTMLASYDLENYLKYAYNLQTGLWDVHDVPLSVEEVICLYGDSCNDPVFHPTTYDRSNPLFFNDTMIYFAPQDFNRCQTGLTTPISKVYPDAPPPPEYDMSLIPDSLKSLYLTDDGYFKYYEYQLVIEDLLPTVPYYVSVTAFDVGSPSSGLSALESSRSYKAQMVYPMPGSEEVKRENLDVFVYPNPYRIDEGYLDSGYEGRNARYYIPERSRLIHFANVPPSCWIRIYSLDGDLVRELRHDMDPSDPTSSHATWDMITRNTQATVSGLYYWTVEDDHGQTQIGKLVIIK